jgi:hypothetical protein
MSCARADAGGQLSNTQTQMREPDAAPGGGPHNRARRGERTVRGEMDDYSYQFRMRTSTPESFKPSSKAFRLLSR